MKTSYNVWASNQWNDHHEKCQIKSKWCPRYHPHLHLQFEKKIFINELNSIIFKRKRRTVLAWFFLLFVQPKFSVSIVIIFLFLFLSMITFLFALYWLQCILGVYQNIIYQPRTLNFRWKYQNFESDLIGFIFSHIPSFPRFLSQVFSDFNNNYYIPAWIGMRTTKRRIGWENRRIFNNGRRAA